jgi:hypothetical protein
VPQAVASRTDDTRQQLAVLLSMPEPGTIVELGAFLRGVAGKGSLDYRLCAWDAASGSLLGQSAPHNTSSGPVAVGSLVRQTWTLEEPLDVPAGDLLVGVSTDTKHGSAAQWGLYTNGSHLERDAAAGSAWPAPMAGAAALAEPLAAWVEDYVAAPPPIPPDPIPPVAVIAGPACDLLASLLPRPAGVKLDDSLTNPAAVLPGRLYVFPKRLGAQRLEDANGRWDEANLRVRVLLTLGARGEVRGPSKDRNLSLALDAALIAMVQAIAANRRTALWWDAYVEAFVYDATANDRSRGAGLDVVLRLNLPVTS